MIAIPRPLKLTFELLDVFSFPSFLFSDSFRSYNDIPLWEIKIKLLMLMNGGLDRDDIRFYLGLDVRFVFFGGGQVGKKGRKLALQASRRLSHSAPPPLNIN